MSNELAAMTPASINLAAELVEKVVVDGDLANLTPAERVNYYRAVCESVGLNPLTKPFEYLRLNNKLRLYALKTATDQLRNIYRISIELEKPIIEDDLVIVTAVAKDATGRVDSDTGAVPILGLKGEAKANAILKAITKAKRRVTLSMVGLGMLDETEVETIPGAEVVPDGVPARDVPRLSESKARGLADTMRARGITDTVAFASQVVGHTVSDLTALNTGEAKRVFEALPTEAVVDAEFTPSTPGLGSEPIREDDGASFDDLTDEADGELVQERLDVEPITSAQLKALHTIGTKLGVGNDQRDVFRAFIGEVVGRELASSKDLTKQEAMRLLDHSVDELAAMLDVWSAERRQEQGVFA